MMILVLAMASAAAGACKDGTESAPAASTAAATPPASTAASPPAPTASPDHVPAGVTAVQNEMRLLHEAMRDSVTAIAMGTLDTIPESLHSVHRARELTEKALESGEYKLPKNGDKLAQFKELDEAFHVELEKLVAAAQSKSSQATATQLGVVLSKCDGCHTQYRR